MDKPVEKCAVFGASVNTGEAAGLTYNGLLALQHRGQEGAGIAVSRGAEIACVKDVGLVSEVFSAGKVERLSPAHLAVGHTRYSTTGGNSQRNVQPVVTEYLTGRIALAHNGNVVNAAEIKHELMTKGLSFLASSDSEVISSLIAYGAMETGDTYKGVAAAAKRLEGAFSLVILSSAGQTAPGRIFAVRDRHGFRPLCIGESEDGMVVASESCAVESCGFNFVRDVEPGEIVVIENGKIVKSGFYDKPGGAGLCIFEYVYFARPDSIIDNLSVDAARRNMGRILSEECPADADVVCGVPDSGLAAAAGYAAASGLPLVEGFFKNRYIGRSFIFPTQRQRENAVQLKLNPLRANVRDKRVVLIDDSMVRGTTAAKIVRMMRNAGAREVHIRLSSPPFIHTCHFGIDIDSEENLIANQQTAEEIRAQINADSLGYISIDGLKRACAGSNRGFCVGCFSGDYGLEVKSQLKNSLE
ncbi:amidophosphoribosyltransferase [Clostridia bacterium]|nr:amidophosphoribosyltransferase [Clostridia bacterium]